MQPSTLQDFLTDLALDPDKYAAFLRDPDAVMCSSGLAAESQAILKRGDSVAIWRCLADEAGSDGNKPGYRALGAIIAGQCPGPLEPFRPLKYPRPSP
jgi:hypothetical protein